MLQQIKEINPNYVAESQDLGVYHTRNFPSAMESLKPVETCHFYEGGPQINQISLVEIFI